MSFTETDLARSLHDARLVEIERSRQGRRAATVARLQRRAERLSHKAERVSRRPSAPPRGRDSPSPG